MKQPSLATVNSTVHIVLNHQKHQQSVHEKEKKTSVSCVFYFFLNIIGLD
jgi:hypothetical protein